MLREPLVLGAPRTGLWCPSCLLSSGYAVGAYVLTPTGPLQLGVFRACYGCGNLLPAETTTQR